MKQHFKLLIKRSAGPVMIVFSCFLLSSCFLLKYKLFEFVLKGFIVLPVIEVKLNKENCKLVLFLSASYFFCTPFFSIRNLRYFFYIQIFKGFLHPAL